MSAPLIKSLEEYAKSGNISFAMPGHKNGRGIKEPLSDNFFKFDTTELLNTPNMENPTGALQQALVEAADFFKADRSFILVDGSTSGIFIMLMTTLKRGDTLLVNRACHISVINACIALGIKLVFSENEIIEKWNIPDAPNTNAIENAADNYSPDAILITSPSYYGLCADICAIADIAHKRGIPLLVDEAHGAHFAASARIFPKTAMESGADMCVQSAHKTLNAANQTAFLHIKDGIIGQRRAKKAFDMFRTTSPCYSLAASADMARAELSEKGEILWERVHKEAMALRSEFKNLLSPDRSFIGKYNFADIDETRLVLNFSRYNITGYEMANALLFNHSIETEMADLSNIVLIPTPSNTAEEFDILKKALQKELLKVEKGTNINTLSPPPLPEKKAEPCDAFFSDGEDILITNAKGRISKVSVVPYPPGIPTLLPGEVISDEIIEYLITQKNVFIRGMDGEKIEVIKEDC